ncbi:MAG: AMP-binding protein [Bernardetiaceae bacterium]|jgi:long-chain acyl-CoA synthetase|nr:AMP-binding protein [Bernardetiaceae bacterium]
MNDYPWYASYPAGMPRQINPDEFSSLAAMLEAGFKKFGPKVAYLHMGVQLTFAQLDELSAQFAAFLQSQPGLQKGDRIAIQMPNTLAYPIVMFGALRAGLAVVNTNPLYTPREMEHQFNDSGAKAIVILSNFASVLEKVLPHTPALKTVIVTDLGDLMAFPKRQIVNFVVRNVKKMVPAYRLPQAITLRQALSLGRRAKFTPLALTGQDIAFIQYTGGTTGVSKGAVLTHRNIMANVLQMRGVMLTKLNEGNETIVTALPLYHIFSLTVNCFGFVMLGGANLLITNPRDMKAFIGDLKKVKFTVFTGVNTLFNGLLNQADFKTLDFSGLKVSVGGGMAVQQAVAENWRKVTGCHLAEGYGLTETSPVLSCNPLDGTHRLGTIGIPVSSTQLKVVDENGNTVEKGSPGEIWATGPQIMQGYWQRPEETEKVLTDGWFSTGDIGVELDGGFFKIVDRKKDMILVSGFNVYPNEVEDVLALHPKVLEAAAIGVPDAKSTEAVKVFVVKKDPTLSEDELREHCKENLTGYKLPKYIEFRPELPKTNVGKILRRALKEEEMKKRAAVPS